MTKKLRLTTLAGALAISLFSLSSAPAAVSTCELQHGQSCTAYPGRKCYDANGDCIFCKCVNGKWDCDTGLYCCDPGMSC